MARGTPDYFGSVGQSSIGIQSTTYGLSISNYTLSENIPALTAITYTLPAIAAGKRHLFVGSEISCQNQDTIMLVQFVVQSTGYLFNHSWYVTNKYLDLKQYAIAGGDSIQIVILNYHAANVINFNLTLYWIEVDA